MKANSHQKNCNYETEPKIQIFTEKIMHLVQFTKFDQVPLKIPGVENKPHELKNRIYRGMKSLLETSTLL